MNRIYKVIWNKQLGCWQAVSEIAKGHARSKRSPTPVKMLQPIAVFALALLPLSIHAAIAPNTLPTGAQITQGSGAINQIDNTLNITQNSAQLSTNWQSFNVGSNATVNFTQPDISAVAINRVQDSNASQIMGNINANGQVFLLNPNGIVFSKTAQVNVGGLVASTLNLSDLDIKQGQYTLKTDSSSHAQIDNQGDIQTAPGGSVALIAPVVHNSGRITTPNGTTELTAASQVTLTLQDGSLIHYQVDQGVVDGLVNNGGAIVADNGAVHLTAKAKDQLSKAVVNNSGIIEANRLTKNAKGEIILTGDMQTGSAHIDGTLTADGKNGQDGGFIETSAANVNIAATTKVSAASAGGSNGQWLIDPTDITIDSSKASAINTALATTNVTISTANGANNGSIGTNPTSNTQAGDIHVNAALSWSANQALTLRADNNINVNSDITATGANGKLTLQYGQTTSNTNANYSLNNGAKINLQAGQNFSTRKGTNAAVDYTVITALGVQGSNTGTDLQGINGRLGGNYALGADINATPTASWNNGQGFSPIGNVNNRLTGKLDGLGHSVNNLTINRPSADFVGLIGYANGATIQNIGVAGGSITGQHYVGGLVGLNNSSSTINNAYATGNITGNIGVGGLVGYNYNNSTINNAYATGEVTGQNNVGGLVGYNYNNSTINNAYATGEVTGQYYTGGLVGYNYYNAAINNAYATGKVTGQSSVGGLVGYNYNNSTINNAYATGEVNGNSLVGGLVGYNYYDAAINNAYATGKVTGQNNAGGLVGLNYNSTINNSYWNTETSGQTTSAGGAGRTTSQMFDKNNFNGFDFTNTWGNGDNQTTPYLTNLTGNQVFNKNDIPTGIISPTNAPKLYTAVLNINQLQNINQNLANNYVLGNNIDATATASWNNGQGFTPIGNEYNRFTGKLDGLGHSVNNLTINRPSTNYVGLIGHTTGATIQNIGVAGGSITGQSAVGGLVGINSNNSSINNAYATGKVAGTTNYVGGLVGYNYNSTINNAYATGEVAGQYHVGGLVGVNQYNSTINNAYATGKVAGTTNYVGGLVGYNYNSTINNSYWNTETSGQTTSAGGIGRTTSQMFDKNNFTGFDFTNTWGNGDNQTTPYLTNLTGNQVFNKNDIPTGIISPTNAPKLYTAVLNINQLQNINQNLANNYVLGNNIDATATASWNNGQGFTPIGNVNNGFTGKLDGLGHSVNNLTINRPSTNYVGLIGYANGATIQNIGVAGGSITGQYYVGGLVGENYNSTINNAYATGEVNGQSSVGGLVGYNYNSTINNAYATGKVAGQYYAGGLVSYNYNSTINNAYATGEVEGQYYVGGLVGYNYNNSTINNAYATGKVTGQNNVGGLVGYNSNNSTIKYSFWDIDTSGQTTSAGGTGKHTADMQTLSTYTNAVWDIDDAGGTGKIWRIYEGQTAPLLRSFLTKKNITAADQVTTYNGQSQGLNTSTLNGLDASKVFSTQSNAKNVGTYNLAYYSNQQGYDLEGSRTARLTINKAAISAVTGISALDKTYDGTTTANLNTASAAFNGKVTGDQLTATATGSFSDKNAGQGKTVNIQGITLGGTDAGNYSLTDTTATSQATINKAAISAVTGISALDKTYDGTTTATLNTASAAFNGKVTGDQLTATATGSFSDKNAGQGKTVNIQGITLGGTDAGNYHLTDTTATSQATINKAAISAVTGISALDKTYDGTTTATLNTTSAGFTGLVTGDQLSATATGSFSDKNAGQGKTVNIQGITLGGTDAGNYSLTDTTATSQATINKAAISAVTGISALDKTYDGTTTANLNTASAAFNGKVTGDQLSATATGSFSDKNAGQGKTVNIQGITLGGTDAGNYHLTDTTATSQATINKAAISAVTGISALDKTYDGTTTATLNTTSAGFTGLVTGDQLSATATGSFSDKNAGQGKTVNIQGITLGGTDAGNYSLTDTTATSQATINKAAISAVTGISALDKTYDGTTTATLNTASAGFTGLVTGDQLSATATGSFSDKNAGQGKTVNIQGITLGGTDAGNYSLTDTTATSQATINKAAISAVTGISALDKTYDGTTTATLNTTSAGFTGLVTGDQLSATATGSFSDKNAGQGKTVNIQGITLGGTDAGNYSLTDTTATSQATINKAAISAVTGISALDKTYDGTTTATLNTTSAGFTGLVTGDQLSATATGSFSDKNAGQGKTVNIQGITLGGTDAGNYSLTDTTATSQATINKAAISAVTGISALDKTYDGTTTATLNTASAAFTGLVTGDQLSATATGSFSDKNAGQGKTVNIQGITLGGTDAGNYSLTDTTATSQATINKAAISAVTGISALDKTYDGTTTATLNTTSAGFTGLVTGDQLSATATGSFSDKNAGQGKTVNIQGITLGGTDAGNYSLTDTTATSQATINKAAISAVTGISALDKTYDGTTTATLNTTSAGFTGLVTGDQLSATATGSFSDKNAGQGKTVNIQGITLGGTDAGNYSLTDTTATSQATINKAAISAVTGISALDKTYDGTTTATLNTASAGFTGLVTGDQLSATATGSFSDKNAGQGKTVNIQGITLGGTDAGNYSLTDTTATSQATINKAAISDVTGISALDKTYDGTTTATLNTASAGFTGLVTGDQLSATATGSFSDKNAGQGKTVNIQGITLGGTDAGNYSLTDTTATSQATINKAAISAVTGISALDKTYDGTTTATLNTASAAFTGLVTGDQLSATATGSFSDKNAGQGKTVNIQGITLGGTDAGNYSLTDTTATSQATINKAAISAVTGISALDKTYDGTTTATLNTTSAGFTGLVTGDQLSATATGSFSDKNAGQGKTVNIQGITLGGTDAGNYSLTDTTATSQATINKAAISAVTGISALDKTYDGTTTATLNTASAAFTGLVTGDQLSATATGSFSDKNAGQGKTVNIQGITLGGTDAGNYSLTDTTATSQATINKAAISAVTGISALDKTYDGTTTATLNTASAGFTGLVTGDQLSATATGSFSDKNAGQGKTVNIQGITLGGTDAGNYTLTNNTATTTASIRAAGTTGLTPEIQQRYFQASSLRQPKYVSDIVKTFLDQPGEVQTNLLMSVNTQAYDAKPLKIIAGGVNTQGIKPLNSEQ